MSSNLQISNNSYHPIEFAKSPELCIPAVFCTLIALAIIAVLATTPIPVGSVGFDCILTAGALSVVPGLGIAVYVLWRNCRTNLVKTSNLVEDSADKILKFVTDSNADSFFAKGSDAHFVEIPDFVMDYNTNYRPEESNLRQDWNREQIFYNNERVGIDQIEAKFGENKWFVNQAFFNALFIKLKEAFVTDTVEVVHDKKANSLIIVYNESENAFYGSNIFYLLQVSTEEKSQLQGKMRVDLNTGHAVASWKSPLTNEASDKKNQ